MAGSKVGETVVKGAQKIREKVVEGAEAVIDKVKDVGSCIAGFFEGLFGW